MFPVADENETTEQWKARTQREMHMRKFLDTDFVDALPDGLKQRFMQLCDAYGAELDAMWTEYYTKEAAYEKAMFRKVYEMIRDYDDTDGNAAL